MDYCGYIYTPTLSDAGIRSLLTALRSGGVAITHLGKHDPPKRWSGDEESAVLQILSGTDLTNETFLRDSKSRLEFTIEMHRDSRWDHDTVSLSGAPEDRVRQVAELIAGSIPHYVAIIGVVGGGKSQAWRVVRMSRDCPDRLRRQFTNAEPSVAPNGGPATQLGNSNITEGPPSVS